MKKKNSTQKQISDSFLQKLRNYFEDKEYFTPSDVTRNRICGFSRIKELEPLMDKLVEEGKLVKEDKRIHFSAPQSNMTNPITSNPVETFDEDTFTEDYRDELEEEIKKYKTFVVTTAVVGKHVNKPFLESIKNYAKRNKALLLVLPCEDVASRGKKASPIELSNDLKDFKVVFKDTYLNRNLCLCAIKTSAKQINPLTGLDRLPVSKEASIIVASPKVFLKYIANMHYAVPPALMTTGAITENNYDTDKYMSKRTAYLAEHDHTYGAIVVEVEDDHIFHFRHIQATDSGAFTDLGVEYLPNGNIKELKDTIMVMGDSHVGYHDKELHDQTMVACRDLNVNKIILHDIFNGTSITHHDIGKSITRATKAQEGRLGLELECVAVKNYLEDIEQHGMEIFIVRSNHDLSLDKYLERGGYVDDPMNHKFSLKLAAAAVDGMNPLQYAIESLIGYKKEDIHWLETDKSYKFYGVEVGLHGDLGSNGSRPNVRAFNNGIGNCVTAHTHSAAIFRNTYTVGTVGSLHMDYNKGMSSWTHTCCLIYSDGTKQLINFILNTKGNYSYTIQ